MTMTRKDFISIATAIEESTIIVDSLDIDDTLTISPSLLDKKEFIKNMCIILRANNERFDSSKFINACYNSSE